jgi:hypothetical protein
LVGVGVRRRHGQPLAVAADAFALVAEINGRHFELFLFDVFPHVHFRPVGEREDAHVFAGIHPGVVKIPDFRALVFGVPLAEASRKLKKRSLARAFSSSRRAPPMAAVELKFLNGAEQHGEFAACCG